MTHVKKHKQHKQTKKKCKRNKVKREIKKPEYPLTFKQKN